MPFIRTTTNKTLTDAQKSELRKLCGRLITKFPGKTEAWLMISVSDSTYMAFRGEDGEDMAMVEVDLLGKPDPAACDAMTEAICREVGALLGIDPAKIYVKYSGYEIWGYNGTNF